MYQISPVDYLTFLKTLSKLKIEEKSREVGYGIYSIICAGLENPTNKMISTILFKKEETLRKYIPDLLDKAILLNNNESKNSRRLFSFFPTNTTTIAKLISVNNKKKQAIFSFRVPKLETLVTIYCVFDEKQFLQTNHLIPNEYYYFNYSSLQKLDIFTFQCVNPSGFITIDKLNLSICDRTGVPSLINPDLQL